MQSQPLIKSWQGQYPAEEFKHIFVIGLAGLAHSGKTAIADQIIEECRQLSIAPPRRLSFATRLKAVLSALIDNPEDLSDKDVKERQLYGGGDWSIREFLIRFGTDFMRRELGSNIWVDIIADQLSQLPERTLVLIDDVRFQNEAELVKAIGMVVLINRPGIKPISNHASEQPQLLKADVSVQNDGTIEEAARETLKLAQQHPNWRFTL